MTPLTPELKAYLDEWQAERKRIFDDHMARMDDHMARINALPRPTTKTTSNGGPVQASYDTTEIIRSSAGLAEPQSPAPTTTTPLVVVPVVPIDTGAMEPATCSTECAAQVSSSSADTSASNGMVSDELASDNDADEHGALLASSSLSSSTTQFTVSEDGSPTAPTSCATLTPTMSSTGDPNRAVTEQWSAPAPVTALTVVVDLIPVHDAAAASTADLDGQVTCGVALTPATCSTGGLFHGIGGDIPESVSLTPSCWPFPVLELGILTSTKCSRKCSVEVFEFTVSWAAQGSSPTTQEGNDITESPPCRLGGTLSTGFCMTPEWAWLLHGTGGLFSPSRPYLPAPAPKPPWPLLGHGKVTRNGHPAFVLLVYIFSLRQNLLRLFCQGPVSADVQKWLLLTGIIWEWSCLNASVKKIALAVTCYGREELDLVNMYDSVVILVVLRPCIYSSVMHVFENGQKNPNLLLLPWLPEQEELSIGFRL